MRSQTIRPRLAIIVITALLSIAVSAPVSAAAYPPADYPPADYPPSSDPDNLGPGTGGEGENPPDTPLPTTGSGLVATTTIATLLALAGMSMVVVSEIRRRPSQR